MALKHVPGVGPHVCKILVERFGSPENVFNASLKELESVPGVSRQSALAISGFRPPDGLKRELDAAVSNQCRIITYADREYPSLLRVIHDPPPYLYVKGDVTFTDQSMAVVGSRQASSYGISVSKRMAGDLASLGWTVVSGLARGIDAAAHEGALAANGNTVAVLGCGLGVIYPPENKRLFCRIVESGAVISEFPMMAPPNAYHFPARNRIIAGMCLGVLVVEAAAKSGSLITARLAAEYGRDVFAVPGSIHSAKSSGVHGLLKQGAKLVASVQDIIEEFPALCRADAPSQSNPPHAQADPPAVALTCEESEIYRQLEAYPVHIDALCQKSRMTIGQLAGILLNLELKGFILQMPGKYFCKKSEEMF